MQTGLKKKVPTPNRAEEQSAWKHTYLSSLTTERRNIRMGRKRDTAPHITKGGWHVESTPLAVIETVFQKNFKQILKHQLTQSTEPAIVVDLGCGRGEALREIKRWGQKKVKTIGLTLEKIPTERYEGIDQLTTHSSDLKAFTGKVNLLYSYFGATFHSNTREGWIRRCVNLLTSNGVAYVTVPRAVVEDIRQHYRTISFLESLNISFKIEKMEKLKGSFLLTLTKQAKK